MFLGYCPEMFRTPMRALSITSDPPTNLISTALAVILTYVRPLIHGTEFHICDEAFRRKTLTDYPSDALLKMHCSGGPAGLYQPFYPKWQQKLSPTSPNIAKNVQSTRQVHQPGLLDSRYRGRLMAINSIPPERLLTQPCGHGRQSEEYSPRSR